jgi:gamma-glutamyl:cysteine ligase YbdK (ATP-grasp superfamily)
MADELEATWGQCERVAADFDARLAMIGTLPSACWSDFNLDNMSPLQRYRALNEQVLRLRRGRPIRLSIKGVQPLQLTHSDVMLEAAATSFQIHLKVPPQRAVRFFNASKMLSAPMVALAANSPYLFGHDLWDETRIPLFEQSVEVGASELDKRVGFGIRYANRSIQECFEANLTRYPVLLPTLMDEAEDRLAHLRLHNGTIWRWTRPLVGFDSDGGPHLRIEHRVVPSGPSIPDAVANAAMFFGAAVALACQPEGLESRLPFERARSNFYAAARSGLRGEAVWLDGRRMGLRPLIGDILMPLAREGLARLGIAPEEGRYWLDIIAERVASGQNGAAWQRAYVERHGADMQALTLAYLERQASGLPVHVWPL